VWEILSGREVARLLHERLVDDVAFSADNRHLATACWDGVVRLWRIQPEDLIQEACDRLNRNLTHEEWSRFLPDEPYRPTCPAMP
jgi:WD40 repeat protein